MISGLDQPHPGRLVHLGARHHRFHQPSSHGLVLRRGIDRNRPNADDEIAFIKDVMPTDGSVEFGHHRVNPGSRKTSRVNSPTANSGDGIFRREIVTPQIAVKASQQIFPQTPASATFPFRR